MFFSINYLFYFHIFAAMVTAIFVCLVILSVLHMFFFLWIVGRQVNMKKRINVLIYTLSYIDFIQRKRFIRYLDNISRKMGSFDEELDDKQKQFLFLMSKELQEEIKRLEDDYKDMM